MSYTTLFFTRIRGKYRFDIGFFKTRLISGCRPQKRTDKFCLMIKKSEKQTNRKWQDIYFSIRNDNFQKHFSNLITVDSNVEIIVVHVCYVGKHLLQGRLDSRLPLY